MIEAKFFTVGTYLYKYNLTVLFVSPSKIAHEKFYIYCPPLLLNEIYAHGIEPTTFALLAQCSTIEPQKHCDLTRTFESRSAKIINLFFVSFRSF